MAFSKPKASSTARGYGKDHIAERAKRLTYVTPYDLCGYCRRPLGPEYGGRDRTGRRISRWDLPHNSSRTGYLPGMWHAKCNRREGAIRAQARQTASRLRW